MPYLSVIIFEVPYNGKLGSSFKFAELLNFLESLKVVEQILNDIPKSTLIYKGC